MANLTLLLSGRTKQQRQRKEALPPRPVALPAASSPSLTAWYPPRAAHRSHPDTRRGQTIPHVPVPTAAGRPSLTHGYPPWAAHRSRPGGCSGTRPRGQFPHAQEGRAPTGDTPKGELPHGEDAHPPPLQNPPSRATKLG